MFRVTRYHDISVGHRVAGHENRCARLHGHNLRIHFTCEAADKYGITGPLDSVGRVIDFAVIKSTLCQWLEDHWDHRFLIWEHDPLRLRLVDLDVAIGGSFVMVPFNPTAENIARHLVEVVGPEQLTGEVRLVECTVEETRKCSATYTQQPRTG